MRTEGFFAPPDAAGKYGTAACYFRWWTDPALRIKVDTHILDAGLLSVAASHCGSLYTRVATSNDMSKPFPAIHDEYAPACIR